MMDHRQHRDKSGINPNQIPETMWNWACPTDPLLERDNVIMGTKEENRIELLTYSEQQAALTLISQISSGPTGLSRWFPAVLHLVRLRHAAQDFLNRRHNRIRDRLSR